MRSAIHNRGFVALMSVVIISAMLLTLIFMMNLSSFFARYDAFAEDNKRVSLGLAEACVESAKLKIVQALSIGSTYSVSGAGTPITVSGSNTCRICSVTNSGSLYTTQTRAAKNGSYSNITVQANVTMSTFSLTSYAENATNPNPSCTLP